MENIQEKARNYFFSGNSEKELQLARLGFVEGYKQALKDSKAPEMLECMQWLLKSPNLSKYVRGKVEQLIKEAITL